jgi:hypothetical protein
MQEELKIKLEEHLASLKPQIVHYGKQDNQNEAITPKKAMFVGADFSDPNSQKNPNFDPQIF